MSKWINRLKDVKNVVLNSNNEAYPLSAPAEKETPSTVTEAAYPTLLNMCVPDSLEASGCLPDASIRESSKNTAPNGSKPPRIEVSGSYPTQPDASQKQIKYQGVTIPPRADTIPRLPFALERVVSAAGSNLLSGFTFDGVPDINNYVRALACDYLIGDQRHALDRLYQVQIAREASA